MTQPESLLDGAEVAVDDSTLDRIDAIVPPGTDAYDPDGAWTPVWLSDPARRRRPIGNATSPEL